MARDDLLKIPGKVTQALSGGQFIVTLENGAEIMAKLSGRLRKYRIRVLVGDQVIVGMSPYDTSHGLIVERERLKPRPAPFKNQK